MSQRAEDSYYVPEATRWPIVGSVGMVTLLASAAFWMNDSSVAPWTFLAGVVILIYMLVGWFGEVIRESEDGMYSAQVDASFRLGMLWFIFSEVMFFAAWFWAFFGAALAILSVGVVSAVLLWTIGAYSWDRLMENYGIYYMLLVFPEAFLTGAMMTIFVVYRPAWVTSFDDDRYLRKRD